MSRRNDLTGQRFGRWTVLRAVRERGRLRWLCHCDCGTERAVRGERLRAGETRSCGCGRFTRNGASKHPLFDTWRHMISRCTDPNDRAYPGYGGRGIAVCERWLVSIDAFCDDMGPRPSTRHSIDRIDNDGDYEPGNCRWATPRQQQNNQRSNRLLTAHGETLTLAQWARRAGISWWTLRDRLKNGWPVAEAVTAPRGSRKITLLERGE